MIRVALSTDLPAIVEIYNEAVEDRFATADLAPTTVAERQAWLEQHDPARYPVFLDVRDRRVCGWCSLSAYRRGRAAVARTAEISYYVARDARRQGVGLALVEHAVAIAPSLGLRVLFAIILERNTASIRLMERCGFSMWGRLPDVAEIDGELVSHVYYGRGV